MTSRYERRQRKLRRAKWLILGMLADHTSLYGEELWRLGGISSGWLYIALRELEHEGRIVGEWTTPGSTELRRRAYRLTSRRVPVIL